MDRQDELLRRRSAVYGQMLANANVVAEPLANALGPDLAVLVARMLIERAVAASGAKIDPDLSAAILHDLDELHSVIVDEHDRQRANRN